MSSLRQLRQQLAEVIAPPLPAGSAIPTGIAALDAALSEGGLPCGRLTEITGKRGSGKTTLVRALVASALEEQRWVAYIDTARTLSPTDWAPLASSGRLWIVRPPVTQPGAPEHGAWCADVLLRSGAFGLVVLDGDAPLSRNVAVRLTRLARESNAAFLVLRDEDERTRGATPLVGGAVRLRVVRRRSTAGKRGDGMPASGPRPRPLMPGDDPAPRPLVPPRHATEDADAQHRLAAVQALRDKGGHMAVMETSVDLAPSSRSTFTVTVSIEKGGTHHAVEVSCAIDVARRLCAHSAVPDRRGVAPRNRRGERVAPDASRERGAAGAADGPGDAHATPPGSGNATLQHKRRCAEPAIDRDEFLLARRPSARGAAARSRP